MGAAAVESPPPAWALRDATEWQGFSGHAEALVRPGTAHEIAAVVAWCYERDVPIAVRGGGTGLAGGAVPDGGLVLSLDRLDRVRRVSPETWTIEAEAGVTTATVARRARESGLAFPVDPGAAESSQIGGNVATNAGGPHSVRHGAIGRWVAGLEAVLAPGELVRAGHGLPRDVAGYDLPGLLCGAEGTLGIVTAVTLRLLPAAAPGRAFVVFHRDAESGARAAAEALAAGEQPGVLDFLDAGTLASARAAFPGEVPESAGFALLCEDVDEEAVAAGALAVAAPPPAQLWRWRAGVSHAVAARRGGKLSDDVAVPLGRLDEAVRGVIGIGGAHGLPACSWGHAADGIVHATLMLDPRDGDELERARAAAEEIFDLALRLGGTITGEHGVGRLKRHRVAEALGPGATEAMRAVKRALDPKGLLNPGVKVP